MKQGLREQIRNARAELADEGVTLNPITAARVLWRALRREHASPGRLAAAVAVGVFIGSLPIYPHWLLSIVVAIPLRLNKLVVVLTNNFSNPFFAPLLYYSEFQLGHVIWTGRMSPLTFVDLQRMTPVEALKTFFLTMLIGALVLGVVLAAGSSLLTYLALALRARRRAARGG